jgi:hypothetical protein
MKLGCLCALQARVPRESRGSRKAQPPLCTKQSGSAVVRATVITPPVYVNVLLDTLGTLAKRVREQWVLWFLGSREVFPFFFRQCLAQTAVATTVCACPWHQLSRNIVQDRSMTRRASTRAPMVVNTVRQPPLPPCFVTRCNLSR